MWAELRPAQAKIQYILGVNDIVDSVMRRLVRALLDQIVSEFVVLWFTVEATLHNLKVAVQFKQYMIHMFSGSCVRKVRSYLRRIFLSNRIHRWPLKRRFYLAEGHCCG